MSQEGVMHHPDQDTERSARQKAVELYAAQLFDAGDGRSTVDRIHAELAGRDLVCWCPSGQPCHADVLLQVANRTAPATAPLPARAIAPTAERSDLPTSQL